MRGRCSRRGRAASSPTRSALPVPRRATPRRGRRRSRCTPRNSRRARWSAPCARNRSRARGDQNAQRIQTFATLLAQTKSEYLAQAKAFLARYPEYKAQFVDQQTVDPKALAKFADRLPPATLAVQYFAAPDMLYLFVVAPGNRFQVKSRAVAQTDLYKLVQEYRQHLDAAMVQRLPWADDGSRLYREKVAPSAR